MNWSNTNFASLEKKKMVGTEVGLLTRVPDSRHVRERTVSLAFALLDVGGRGAEVVRRGGREGVCVKTR